MGREGEEGKRDRETENKRKDTSRNRIIINFKLDDELIYLVIMLKFERLLSSKSSPSNYSTKLVKVLSPPTLPTLPLLFSVKKKITFRDCLRVT